MKVNDGTPRDKGQTEVLKIQLPVVDNSESHDEELEATTNQSVDAYNEYKGEVPTETTVQLKVDEKVVDEDTEVNYVQSRAELLEETDNQIQIENRYETEVKLTEGNSNFVEHDNQPDVSEKMPGISTEPLDISEETHKISEETLKGKILEEEVLKGNVSEVQNDGTDISKDNNVPFNTVTRPITHHRKQINTLTTEEEDLGIYEDTADGDDLTDTEIENLKSKFKNVHLKPLPKKLEKIIDKAETKTEVQTYMEEVKFPIKESFTRQINPDVIKLSSIKAMSAPKKMQDFGIKDIHEGLGQRGKTLSCIRDVFQESRNASRLALESREAMFRRAMTLLSARCTSVKQGLDAGDMKVPFGIQIPKYFYVTQEKPFPMEPLKAWRGYNGNVYFEPIQVNPLKNPLVPDSAMESPKDIERPPSKQTERKSIESDKSLVKATPGSESRIDSRQTAKTTGSEKRPSPRQMVILDKQTVINKFNESIHEDIVFLEGQENTGSLAIRPRTQPNPERKKDLLYNKERICKGSVAHKLYVEKHPTQRRPRFSVSGGKFTPPNSMSPLLRAQTQYSLSSHRLTTNSPDMFHLHDNKLPPLDQIKASLKHTGGSREKLYTRPLTITDEMKPFVKYSPDVVAKFAQQAL